MTTRAAKRKARSKSVKKTPQTRLAAKKTTRGRRPAPKAEAAAPSASVEPSAPSASVAAAVVQAAIEQDCGARVTNLGVELVTIHPDYATLVARRRLTRVLSQTAETMAPELAFVVPRLGSRWTVGNLVQQMVIPTGSYRCPRGDFASPVSGRCPTHRILLVPAL